MMLNQMSGVLIRENERQQRTYRVTHSVGFIPTYVAVKSTRNAIHAIERVPALMPSESIHAENLYNG